LTNGLPVTRTKILKVAGGIAVALAFFFATLAALELFGSDDELQKPELAEKPPLPEATRQSVIVAPVAIPIAALREAMEQAAPRNLSGAPDNQISKLLAKADIGFMLERSPLTLIGRADGLTIATSLNGSFRASGQLPSQIGERISGLLSERDKERISGALSGLLKEKDREKVANFGKDTTSRASDQQADVKGDVHIVARPTITTAWRLEPNLVGQVKLAEANVQVAGVKVNAASEIKPMIDRAMSNQMLALGNRLRNDAFIENAARREWAKLCRSVALGSQGSGLPNLFLELRPTRAFAAQPRVDAYNVTLTLGIQADTRVVPEATKPDCPFPARLDIVPSLDQGKVTIGLPIDVPFSEVSKLLESQLKDKVFPDDRSSPAEVTVQRAIVSAIGERLLVTLRVKARERQSWFGLGTEATMHISGKPVLDQNQQIVRLEEVSLAVESEALFGLIGVAAKTAIPSLQAALERNAVVDLKPALANARRSIDKALSDFRLHNEDIKVDATMTGLRLIGIEFDSRIVRVTAEADGIARVALTKLPGK
jgi:hypothetical protein